MREKHLSVLHKALLAGLVLFVLPARAAPASGAAGALRMISIDVEGGAATLFVTPEGKSLLIDTGWPAAMAARSGGETSAQRIAAAAASLGVTRIDDLIITHYHADHVGGVESLLEKLPVDTFIDHGPNRQPDPPGLDPKAAATTTAGYYAKYLTLIAGHRHVLARPGDTLRIGSMSVTFVSADGQMIAKPLPGAGKLNPACAGIGGMSADGGEENARSVGSIIRFGTVKIAALGDLSWNKEGELFCPIDRVGPVDVLIVTQHGSEISSNPASLDAMRPIVAVMGNGATKGGDAAAIRTVAASPRLQGFWRNHGSTRHPETDGPADYIANPVAAPDEGHAIRLRITGQGAITVTNDRNAFSKTYHAGH